MITVPCCNSIANALNATFANKLFAFRNEENTIN